jgi:phosphate/sulfate permease
MGIITLALVTATSAGTFKDLPNWLHFLKMDKTSVAEEQIMKFVKGATDQEAAAILESEADKLKAGEFKEAFYVLAGIVYEAGGNSAAATSVRTKAHAIHEQDIVIENARFLPKVPLIGQFAASKPNDWQKALDGAMESAAKKGKPVIPAAASKVNDITPGVPAWIKIICALVMAAGTASGGWRIIKTMGHKMVKLQPVHGFAAETTAATLLAVTGKFGMTVSTTHAITTAIMGVGATKRFSAIDGQIVKKILGAWILTLPAAAGVAYVTMWIWLKVAG